MICRAVMRGRFKKPPLRKMRKSISVIIFISALTLIVLANKQRCQAQNTGSKSLGETNTMAGIHGLETNTLSSGVAFVERMPRGYRDWTLISVSHEEGNLNSFAAILGNDVAIR